MTTTTAPRAADILSNTRIADHLGRDAVYFTAALGDKRANFVLTHDALELIDDSRITTRAIMQHAFDTRIEIVVEKVFNILTAGIHLGDPMVLQASDFER